MGRFSALPTSAEVFSYLSGSWCVTVLSGTANAEVAGRSAPLTPANSPLLPTATVQIH